MVIAISNYCPIFGQTIEIKKEKKVLLEEAEDVVKKQTYTPFYHSIQKPFLIKRIKNRLSLMRSTKKVIKQPKGKKN